MSRISSRLMVVCVGAALLSGCASSPPPIPHLPEMHFTQGAPIRLDIARIDFQVDYQAPAQPPHIEYDMPVSPENAVRRWVQDRIKPVGSQGVLRVLIRNASATETPLATDQGFTGMFKKEQAAKVELSLDIALQMLDDHQMVIAEVTGKAQRSSTEPEGQKLNDRDKLLYDLTYQLVKDMNDEVSPDMPTAFGRWMGR